MGITPIAAGEQLPGQQISQTQKSTNDKLSAQVGQLQSTLNSLKVTLASLQDQVNALGARVTKLGG
jgi:translation initiation factor 2B subunit (eIF-2B alpha/beta/delta family)